VKKRLAVLEPSHEGNYYEHFDIVPSGLRDRLRQGRVLIRNWQAAASNLMVINDEAHHAWRVPAESKVKGVAKADVEEATRWVGGLDRIHRTSGILTCYDFSATPFAPSGKESHEEALFGWIVSDFGLNDAIESGLVKTPRVVVRDDALPDAKTYRSKLYHIYKSERAAHRLEGPGEGGGQGRRGSGRARGQRSAGRG